MRHSPDFSRRDFRKNVEVGYNIDEVRVSIFCLTLLLAGSFAAADDLDNAVSTDDICAVRPDLCGSAATRKKKRKKPSHTLDFSDFEDKKPLPVAANNNVSNGAVKKKKRKKTKSSGDSMKDFWEKEFEDEIKPLDIDGAREPASVKPAAAPPPPKPKRPRISYAAYMTANHAHTAIGGNGGPRQDAFQQPYRPATFTSPEAGQSVRETPPAPAAPENTAPPPAPPVN